MFITEKHRIDLEFIEILKVIEGSLNYITYPMDVAVVLKCHELKAILLDACLITKDKKIVESGEVAVVW